MAWVEAWMRGCMLTVSGRGQVVHHDEPERHIAGERWRDDRAVVSVSAVWPCSVCVVCAVGSVVQRGVCVGARSAGVAMGWVAAGC